jgi:poly-gamma-glutamate synthesis protein (capsule biosynthesis protein)
MRVLTSGGLISVVLLCVAASLRTVGDALPQPGRDRAGRTSLLAVGDINLGRFVGQQILLGDTLYPFVSVQDTLAQYDIVFGNLESQLSEQNGSTEHPENNLIFTGPPAGAYSLQRGKVSIVSTANNHAMDYGLKGHRETRKFLADASIAFVGTAEDSTMLYEPVILERHGITVAFLACTDVMNIQNPMWKSVVAQADTARILPVIRAIHESVDFLVVSYHGGDEYAATASRRTREFARTVIAEGADLFLGHHPHVPYGVERFRGKYIVHSLGNFVFRQPDRLWTQLSFAFAVHLVKHSGETVVESVRCLPVRAGFQPQFLSAGEEFDLILERIRELSTDDLATNTP